MKAPITQKMLIGWGGADTLRNAESMLENGMVLKAEYDEPYVHGSVLWNNRELETSFEMLSGGMIESACPCRENVERGMICSHVIALGLSLVRRATDPMREAKYNEETRRASRVSNIDDSEYIKRVSEDTAGAIPVKLIVQLGDNWADGVLDNKIPIKCSLKYRKRVVPIDKVSCDTPLTFSKKDESLLFVLEDIAEGPAKHNMELNQFDFANLLRLHTGNKLETTDDNSIAVNETRLTTLLRMDLDRETGELILIAHTELPFMQPGQFPVYIVAGNSAWVYGADNFWPIENVLPAPYHSIYREPVILGRRDVLRFLQQELPTLTETTRVESDISLDLFTISPSTPRYRLHATGSPASLSAVLYAVYDDTELVACKPDAQRHFAIPDPDDLMAYHVRNIEHERRALDLLAPSGLVGETGDSLRHIAETRGVLNFLGTHLPRLRRHGWRVDLEGRVAPHMESLSFATPVVHIEDHDGRDWFDVGFDFEDSDGQSISQSDIQLAIRKGDSFLERNGKIVLIDTQAIECMQDVFADCDAGGSDTPGHFRVANIYSAFVKSSLDSLDGIDVEGTGSWQESASRYNRTADVKPVKLPQYLERILRPYQKDGIYWLRFLEEQGFCGLLSDEMGLGKTLQALAWLQLKRHNKEARVLSSLVVSPTSLVGNWAEECAKFVPDLTVLDMTGPDRHEKWGKVDSSDIILTSYAILRRDLDRYLQHEFAVAILDEAQHIKNRSTQNAVAAKQIRAHHKLVLTGTPVENSVSDIWSIMDFLMPGYLGKHATFRQNYELPMSRGEDDGKNAQIKLRRKLHPFLMRRKKVDVAKDLPDKIQRVASCTLTPDQKAVYNEYLRSSQQRVADIVSKKGFNKARMEVLTVLMRLRQICCHLDLLKLPDLSPKRPSAKMDLFFELVDEAVDSGHRILVFSQFVSMLGILQDELTQRSLQYCYLDGKTKNRIQEVHRFNTERSIPLFLISLKAGGTGLNLTGADMVIHFDPWWNPAVEDQATDRAHRIGQKRTVYSIKLITKDTVEEKVLAMQRRKKSVIDSVVESDEAMITSLSWDDVQNMLGM